MKGRRVLLIFGTLICFSFVWLFEAISQSASKESPILKLGEISFRVREIESASPPFKILEIYIEVLNRSRTEAAPAHSIKVGVSQREIAYSGPNPAKEFTPPSQVVTLSIPLPPLTGRVFIFGFPLPEEKVESITFEVQLNPPDGEKKSITYRF